MPRKPRVTPVGIAQHVIQRGNNRQACFAADSDFAAYAGWLKEYADKFEVSVHAWVFMTNHIHLLCTPQKTGAVSAMLQSLGRMYVRYFNYTYRRTGTLWEGRYKSCLVQDEAYVMQLYRYIELNPVRAGMVQDPANYNWSSYQCNGLGKRSDLITPHSTYLALSANEAQRQESYRSLFKYQVDVDLVKDIQEATQRGLALGNERFKDEIERLTGIAQRPQKRGRPVGWRKRQ